MTNTTIEAYEQFKQLEQEWNQHLISTVNCRKFVLLSGKMLDLHLDQVIEKRKLSENWLKSIDAPTKDDVAMIANLFIRLEQKSDTLEEELFSRLQKKKSHLEVLKQCNRVLKNHKTTLDLGAEFLKPKTELELLKEELEELIAN